MKPYYLAALLSVLSFVTIGPFVKALSPGLSIPVITFGRAFFGFLFVVVLVKKTHLRGARFQWKNIPEYGFIGLMLAATMSLYNFAFTLSPLADVVLLNYAHVFISPLLAWFLLRERVEKKTWFYLAAGLVGVAIVNPFTGQSILGNLAALGAGVTYSIMAVYMRKVDKHHGLGDVVYFLGFAALFLLPMAVIGTPTLSITLEQLALLAAVGIISTGSGYFFFNYALRGLHVHVVSTIDLALGTLAGILFSVYFYREPLTWNIFLGGGIIIAAGLLFMRGQRLLHARLKFLRERTGIYATAFVSRKIGKEH